MIRSLLCLLLLQFIACRHQIEVKTLPASATLYHKDKELGDTPVEITFWWFPFRPFPITAKLNGYRPMKFEAGNSLSSRLIMRDIFGLRIKRLLGIETRNIHTIQLIREHGPAGTWTPEEATY